jgi:hypothetical protein
MRVFFTRSASPVASVALFAMDNDVLCRRPTWSSRISPGVIGRIGHSECQLVHGVVVEAFAKVIDNPKTRIS